MALLSFGRKYCNLFDLYNVYNHNFLSPNKQLRDNSLTVYRSLLCRSLCYRFCFILFAKMMRKVTKDEPNRRPNRPRRRRFEGNQFSSVPNVEVDEEVSEEASVSAKKLKASAEDVIVNPSMCYRIIEFISVFSALADLLVCKVCKQKVKFEQSGERGLGFKIAVQCRCGTSLIQSGPLFTTVMK